MRRLLLPLALLLPLTSCTPRPLGPTAPIAREQVTPAPALDASAARQAVLDFIEAYRDSPQEGVAELSRTVAGDELSAWVRWLGVQHREFDGTITAVADVRDVEFIGSIQARGTIGAQVGLSASVTFRFDPFGDDPIELTRVLDGPVTLVRTGPGGYRVVDLLRNGVPMSDGIQLFRNEIRTRNRVTVRLDSLFMFPPNWQFNVLVENHGAGDLILEPAGTALFARRDGKFERIDGVVTGSLRTVRPGATVEGLMIFPSQETAQGRVLTIAYREGRRLLRFAFPLEDLVTVVPPPPPTGAGEPESAPG